MNVQENDGDLRGMVNAIEAPGVAVGIFDRSGLLWHAVRGVCDTRTGEPVAVTTRFGYNSITKTFTGMAVLSLRDAGALSLDDPLVRHVPEAACLRPPTADSPPITLRHLLTHTSGLPRGVREVRKQLHRDPSEREILAYLSSLALESSPGTGGSYSNLGYALLGIVIKRASGQEYDEMVRRGILTPLGLANTSFQPIPPVATPHRKVEREGFAPSVPTPDDSYLPVGGIYGSLVDLVRYLGVHLNAWPPRDEPDDAIPLRRATMRESHRPGGFHRVGRNSKGLGWAIERYGSLGDIVHHSGASPSGYSSFGGFEPDRGIGIAGLANANVELEQPLVDLLKHFVNAQGFAEDRRS